MNFLLCNRCNKKSEDNLLNFNNSEISLKNKNQNIINNNIINQIETIEQFQNLNIGENIACSINNLNNLEDDPDEELEIIEYPYSQKEALSKFKQPKFFRKNKSKFNNPNLVEKDIINKLYHSEIHNKANTQTQFKKKKNFKVQLDKISNIKIPEEEIESKDTMTDPANLALCLLIKDMNKKNLKEKNKNIKNNDNEEEEEGIITIDDELECNRLILKNFNENKNSKIKSEKNNNNLIKKDKNIIKNQKNKNILNNNNNVNNNKKNIANKINQRKISSKNKKVGEYKNNIIKKKNILRNKRLINNLGINSLSFSSKNQFPKSYSFNCFNSEKKSDICNEFGYNLTFKKKNNDLCNNLFKNKNIKSNSKKNNKNLRITNINNSKAQMPIQKACSSHIVSYHYNS